MKKSFVSKIKLSQLAVWENIKKQRIPLSFGLELTARCNNNCRHCYINLPAADKKAKEKELSFDEIKKIVDQAVDLGAAWCLITGGEPLLREDFFDIYLYLKKKGVLTSVFTNATLINQRHIKFFQNYPPRDIEVTVYGVTRKTYESVTRKSGSFEAFMTGLNLLLQSGIKVRFKTMALRSNLKELPRISAFCRERSDDYFRFDPFLQLRFDGNKERNNEIKSERLRPEEIGAIEKKDLERLRALEKECDKFILPGLAYTDCDRLFRCGAGRDSFTVGYDGFLRLCPSLYHPSCIRNLKKGSLSEAWQDFIPRVRDMRSKRKEFLAKCRKCELINLCPWCPAHAYLETGELDTPVDYFCKIAHVKAEFLLPALSK